MFLTLDALTLRYPGSAHAHRPAAAVSNVSLGLARGEIGVLIGPSGCGKTSLLRAVAGLEPLAGGRIAIDGQPQADAAAGLHLPPEARRVGMVFQDFALFPHLSVAENIGFGLHAQPRGQRQARVQQMLELVGLAHAARRAPHQLSGGQQQRVALARALAPAPRLLLLDEPFSSLDVDLREHLAGELRAILKAAGSTALFVTHDQAEAFALADVVGVMQQGVLEQWDAAYTVYHRPATRFVATFIGHSVFLPATPQPDGQLATALGMLPGAGEVGPQEVLLRADDIIHDDDAPTLAQIERKVFRGAEFLYTLRLASGEPLLAHVPSHHDHQIGEWIGIRAHIDHVVTFGRGEAPNPH